VAALSVLAVAGAIAAYVVLHRNGSDAGATGGDGTGGGARIQLVGVRAWDPYGDGQEHDADAHLATDASSSTSWETETYRASFQAIGKKGVGLVLDAGRSQQLHQLGFSSSTPGFTAEILAGDSEGGPFDAVVGASQTVGKDGQAEYRITGGPHRFYVIWITSLGASYHLARINDVQAN
jgi:hypothetical protein